jgi:predicted ATPase
MDERFVRRSTELTFLRERLDEARRGAPRMVLLEGAAGIGKTALLREFLAGHGHDRVLRGSGEELEARLTYGVIEQLVAVAGGPLPPPLTVLGTEQGADADPLQVGGEHRRAARQALGAGPASSMTSETGASANQAASCKESG